MTFDAHLVAEDWLSTLATALQHGDASAVATLFLPDGWLRDALVLTWDLRTLEGRDKITTYLSESLQKEHITQVRLDDTGTLAPRQCKVPFTADMSSIEFGFKFELPHGHGRGLARLIQDPERAFRAFTVLLTLQDLRAHEELSRLPLRDDVTGLASRDMERELAESIRQVEKNPFVLIGNALHVHLFRHPLLTMLTARAVVGGGQSGLHVAARFKQMNIPSLVIERSTRVGESWRSRYPTLALHTVRRHHSLLYQPFPSTWPEFTSRDKLAGWLEQYATTQDLVVWTNTELRTPPRYNDRTAQWDVTVTRDGHEVQLHPSHIVMATGLSGRPLIPDFPDLKRFQGQYMHSSEFPGGAPFAGKRVVVVGAANSSIDICQDLVFKGADSVTMIQRSETCVVSRDSFNEDIKEIFPEDEPLDVSDLKFDPYLMYYDNGGGLDKGGAELIGKGSIKVKSGQSVERFTETGLVLSDGTELPADVVVFARSHSTGYTSIRESNTKLLGPDVMNRVRALWFAGGDFLYSRFFSKQLGLQIQAIQMGLLEQSTLSRSNEGTRAQLGADEGHHDAFSVLSSPFSTQA
ncbi:FAD/NAD-P-binding domain-containing protein [Cerioporus squamosus]|nr:FAD/NAD-P-binding domain-containing protein [Cerioporus squamosus]